MAKSSSVFTSFYTKNLHRFLSKLPTFSVHEFSALEALGKFSGRDCEFWVNAHIDFLSGLESLAVAISLARKSDFSNTDDLKKMSKFFYNAVLVSEKVDGKKEVIFLAYLGLAICHFERSLIFSDVRKQRQEIDIAEHYLHEASLYFNARELIFLYHTLFQAARGEVASAVQQISKASKVTMTPKPYYEVLEIAYRKLKMENVAVFYRNRLDQLAA